MGACSPRPRNYLCTNCKIQIYLTPFFTTSFVTGLFVFFFQTGMQVKDQEYRIFFTPFAASDSVLRDLHTRQVSFLQTTRVEKP